MAAGQVATTSASRRTRLRFTSIGCARPTHHVRRDGRSMIYAARCEIMNTLLAYSPKTLPRRVELCSATQFIPTS
jgi:hypothetical protein